MGDAPPSDYMTEKMREDIGLKVFAFAKMLASGSLKLLMGLKQMAIGVAKWAMANPRLAIAMGLGAAAIGLFLSSDGGSGGGDTEQGTSDNNIDSEVELNGGGLVPNLAMQGGGMTPDVGSFASYENPRGRVAVKTVLLPLNSESDEASEATVLAAGRSKGRSNFETLYKGGLA